MAISTAVQRKAVLCPAQQPFELVPRGLLLVRGSSRARTHGLACPQPSGFTLLELLTAMVILALISAISVPIYSSYAQRTYRTQAQADLLSCAQGLERFAAINFSYQNSADGDGDGVGDSDTGPIAAEICQPRSQTENRYQLSVTSTVSTYLLTATPSSGAVATDGYLTLDEAGARGWDCNNDGDTADANETSWEEPTSACT